MIGDRIELEKNLVQVLGIIKHDKEVVEKLKTSLKQNGIVPGEIQKLIMKPDGVKRVDLSFLCLLSKRLFEITQNNDISPYNYFTSKEIKIAERQDFSPEDEKIEFPIVLDNVLQLDTEDYITIMPIKYVIKMYNSNLLEYNFETQRNARFVRKHDKIVQIPFINPKSVKEIAEHVLNNTFLPDTITLNVLAGSGKEVEEVVYDAKKKQLVIYESEIDILDGFNRLNGFMNALKKDPEIDLNIQVAIKNYNTRKAQAYVAQINTINKMDKSHLKALKADRYSDFITKELQRDSDLKGKISQTSIPQADQLVSYAVLSDAIDQEFELTTKKEAMDLAQYLTKFFDYLIGSFPDEFVNNIAEVKSKSLINANPTFAGYVVLAKRMKEGNIPLSKLPSIIRSIDFSRDNRQWIELGVLDENRVMTRGAVKASKIMKKFFNELDLEEVAET